MAAKKVTNDAVALTEKKMDMTLDDIIKMSITTTVAKKHRVPNKTRKLFNNTAQDKSVKVQQFMASRSSLRQGALAKRRSNFQGNQFPLAAEVAQKAAAFPIRSGAFNRGRGHNWNTPRTGAPVVQRKATNRGFAVKQSQKVNGFLKQRPHTLDSMFANMKEERMKSQQNNVVHRGQIGQQRQQWGRGRFGQQRQQRERGQFGN